MLIRGAVKESLGSMGCIVLLLGERLEIGFLDTIPEHGLMAETGRFATRPSSDPLFFFDWLRDLDGRLCAVRLWSLGEPGPFFTMAASCSYAITDSDTVTIFFREAATVDERLTEHQAFGNTLLLLRDDGMAAITLGLHFLEEADIDVLLDSCVAIVDMVALPG